MPYKDPLARRRRARLRYHTEEHMRRTALDRAGEQRERVKDDPAYRERWREWQRRSKRKRAASTGPS